MTNKINAFIVKGPPTYMNAEEAWYKFSGKKEGSILFVIFPKGNLYNKVDRMKEVIDQDKWEEIVWIKTIGDVKFGDFSLQQPDRKTILGIPHFVFKIRKLFRLLRDRMKLSRIAKKYKSVDLVFSGNKYVHEHFSAELNPNHLYLLDSGANMIRWVTDSGYIDYTHTASSKSLRIYKKLGYKIIDRKRTSLFTSYADVIKTKHHIERNDHSYKKQIINSKPAGRYGLWINSPLCDQFGVDLTAYVDYMKVTIEKLGIKGSNLIYIPHPGREKKESLDYIMEKLSCRIDDRLLPVEMKITGYEKVPSLVISPVSSSLQNLSVIAGNRIRLYSAWHYEFNNFKRYIEWRKEIEKDPATNIHFVDIQDCSSLFNIDQSVSQNFPLYDSFRDFEHCIDI